MVPVLPNCARALHSHIYPSCFMLLVMGLGPRFMFSSLRAPHCVFCTFRCGLLFELWSLLLFFSCSLERCFSFIYLLIYFCRCLYGTVHTNKVSPPSLSFLSSSTHQSSLLLTKSSLFKCSSVCCGLHVTDNLLIHS
jgi:hypothetical protein